MATTLLENDDIEKFKTGLKKSDYASFWNFKITKRFGAKSELRVKSPKIFNLTLIHHYK